MAKVTKRAIKKAAEGIMLTSLWREIIQSQSWQSPLTLPTYVVNTYLTVVSFVMYFHIYIRIYVTTYTCIITEHINTKMHRQDAHMV